MVIQFSDLSLVLDVLVGKSGWVFMVFSFVAFCYRVEGNFQKSNFTSWVFLKYGSNFFICCNYAVDSVISAKWCQWNIFFPFDVKSQVASQIYSQIFPKLLTFSSIFFSSQSLRSLIFSELFAHQIISSSSGSLALVFNQFPLLSVSTTGTWVWCGPFGERGLFKKVTNLFDDMYMNIKGAVVTQFPQERTALYWW